MLSQPKLTTPSAARRADSWDAQEAVLAADEDLEITQKLHDVNARRLAREAISAKRDIYQEIVDKAQEDCEKLNNGEYEYVDDVD